MAGTASWALADFSVVSGDGAVPENPLIVCIKSFREKKPQPPMGLRVFKT